MEDVDFQRLVAGDYYVDSQIEFVSIDQKWIRNVFANNTCLVHIDVIDVINQIDALALTRVSWFDDPNILLGLMLL